MTYSEPKRTDYGPGDFEFDLPRELIAQEPPPERTGSRLMVLNRKDKTVQHRVFPDILEYLDHNDFLVFNDTRVIPARLFGVKENTGGKVELLLTNQVRESTWEALVKPGKRVKPGHCLTFGDGSLRGEVVGRTDQGTRIIRFQTDHFMEDLIQLGEVPLPPYIKKPIEERNRYQTIYARQDGSSAAPTAGLHFTDEIFARLKEKGIDWTYVTLHIGPGTFRPVKADSIREHDMHSEFYRVTRESVEKIRKARRDGRRIIPVGTTATRTLESVLDGEGNIIANPAAASPPPAIQASAGENDSGNTVNSNSPGTGKKTDLHIPSQPPQLIYDEKGKLKCVEGWTDIFIYPGYRFKMTDALITNFHLPRSTLIMLVSALAGRNFVLQAYDEAVKERYRFFSFGDCMFVF